MNGPKPDGPFERLTRGHATLVRRAWIALEFALVAGAALIVAVILRRWGWIDGAGTVALPDLLAAGLLGGVWTIVMYALGLYHSQRFVTFGGVFAQLCVAHALGAAMLTGIAAATVWSVTLLLFVPLSLLLLTAERNVVMSVLWHIRRRGGQSRRALLVAAEDSAPAVEAIIRDRPQLGLNLVATAPPAELARPDELLDRTRPDELIFSTSEIPLDALANSTLEAQMRGINVRQVVSTRDIDLLRIGVGKLNGGLIVTLFSTRGRPGEVVAKRLVDIVGGTILFALMAPVMAIAALAIATSGGRPIYRQTRIGRYGAPFTMYKFRTMEHGADARLAEIKGLNEMTPPVFKAANDPRVTALGRFLRRWSIDELPQLINVIKGDMSLVGPRPARPHEAEQYETWQKRRLCVKPGLTGPWQVAGRNEVDFADWMRLDAEYVNRWTIWRDLEILVQTVPTIISGRGAH